MSYQKWTPPRSDQGSRYTGLKIVVTKGRYGLVRRAFISMNLAAKFRLDTYGAFDIYIDRERGFIGIDPSKSGAIKVKGGNRCSVFVVIQALQSFGIEIDKPATIVVPLLDVSKTKPPVQLELRVDDVRSALKAAAVQPANGRAVSFGATGQIEERI